MTGAFFGLDSLEQSDSTLRDPFSHDDVRLVDPSRAVRVDELSGDELVFGLTP